MTPPSTLSELRVALGRRWAGLTPREQRSLLWAAWCVGLALLWWSLVAPAWRTLERAPLQRATLSATLQQMQALQARAQALRERPVVPAQVLQKALQNSTAVLGPAARWQMADTQAVLTLSGVPATALAEWMAAQAGISPGPTEAHLTREGTGPEARWSGTLTFLLPVAAP
jgi:general secretion pathway protein M